MGTVAEDELTAFRVQISEDGHDSYGNGRMGPNDDLGLATAIAVYAVTRSIGRRVAHVGRVV